MFNVTVATHLLTVDKNRTASLTIEVSNRGVIVDRPRVLIVPLDGALQEWFTIAGAPEPALFPGDTAVVTVVVRVPRDVPPRAYAFRVDVVSVSQPDEPARGPIIELRVEPEPAPGRPPKDWSYPDAAARPVEPSAASPGAAQPGPGPAVEQPDWGEVICSVCGTANLPERTFCRKCGNALTPVSPSAGPPPPPPAPRSAPSAVGTVGGAIAEAVGGLASGLGRGLRGLRGTRGAERESATGAPPGTVSDATANTRIVERPASATFPPEVEAGAEATLAFSIGEFLGGGVMGFVSIEAPSGATSVDLVATVHAPAFDVASPKPPRAGGAPVVALPLSVDDPSSAVRGQFVLRAKPTEEPADASVLLDFWHHTSPVGQISLATRVVPRTGARERKPARAAVGSFRVSGAAPPPADITLFITDEGAGRYQIQATTPNVFMRDLGAFPAGQNAWSYSAAMLERFRDAGDLPEETRVDRVVGLGLDLWRNLPPAFHDFYWAELHGRDRSIAIYSQEPYIPWELIRPPAENGRSPGFLGSDYKVARWRNGRLFPDPLAVRDFVVIAPTYTDVPLEGTAMEASDLATLFGARIVEGEYAPVSASLRSPDIQMVHFAGHGAFDEDAPQQSQIRLSDQALLPTDVRAFREGQARGPFVFLNACEVGEQGWVFTGIGGWADTFCDVGCAGFVGPYWAVDDEVARLAALRFYGALASGKSVGAAIQHVRQAFDEPGPFVHNPTWLAYSLHCQPNIRIEFHRNR